MIARRGLCDVIGPHDKQPRADAWTGLRYHDDTFIWTDNSPLSVVYWSPKLVNHDSWDNLSCAYIQNNYMTDPGYWGLSNCEEHKGFVCKSTAHQPYIFDQRPKTGCSVGMVAWAKFCYYFVDEAVSRAETKDQCLKQKGRVVTIESLPELYLVKSMLAQRQNETFWTGLTQDEDFSFLRWLPDEPFSGSDLKRSWGKAEEYCNRFGGHLLSDISHGTLEVLTQRKKYSDEVWTGYYTTDFKNAYGADGNVVKNSTEYFHTSLPELGNTTSGVRWCGNFKDITQGISFLQCHHHKPFVCQVNPGYTLIPEPEIRDEPLKPCNNGSEHWYQFNGYCYFYSVFLPRNATFSSWNESRSYCTSVGGDLVSMHFQEEVQFLVKLAKTLIYDFNWDSEIWIGLKEDNNTNHFGWSDKSFRNLELWNPNGGSTKTESRCVVFDWKTGLWNIKDCQTHHMFICKMPTTVNTEVSATTAGMEEYEYCPLTWYPIGERCMKFFSSTKSWKYARAYCKKKFTGELISIRSQEQQDLLNRLNVGNLRFWIGMKDTGNTMDFKWADGTEILYTNWATKEPNDHEVYMDEDCVESLGKRARGEWNDIGCGKSRAFACQTYRDPITVSTKHLDLYWSCSPGYVNLRSGCYKFFGHKKEDQLSWDDAQSTCRQNGGILVSIGTFIEFAELYSFTMEYKNEIWIGYSRDNPQHETVPDRWTDGSLFKKYSFPHWAANTFEDKTKRQCISMVRDKHCVFENCNKKKAFICEEWNMTTIETINYNLCPKYYTDWIDIGSDFCYRPFLDDMTWQDASHTCQELGKPVHLASIHSLAENKKLLSFYNTGIASYPGFWIGLYKSFISGWKWTDYSDTNYTFGIKNTKVSGNNRCVYVRDNEWKVDNCNQKHYFLCAVKKENLKLERKEKIDENSDAKSEGEVNYGLVIGLTITGIAIVTIVAFVLLFIKIRGRNSQDFGITYRKGSESERLSISK
ncbi:Macrophage mannose receptor 1 [Nymphon striatum]|nr:Macrophage mannose receptor 1 [Nymphon striatum]